MIAPEGWLEWEGVLITHLFYAKFNNQGFNADVSKRVNWSGFHVMDKQLAFNYNVNNSTGESKGYARFSSK